MSMEYYRQAMVEVAFKPPNSVEWFRWNVPISEIASSPLEPLPRSRELAFDIEAVKLSQEMTTERWKLAENLGEILARKLYEIFTEQDTIKGYPPKEFRKR